MVNFLLCLISYFKWLQYIVLLKMLFMVCTTIIYGQLVWLTAIHDKFILRTVGYAKTNNPKMNECYNEQFLSIKSGCYNEHRGILSAALIRASVIIFVTLCKAQLSVYFTLLLICAISSENIFLFKLFCYILLATSFH